MTNLKQQALFLIWLKRRYYLILHNLSFLAFLGLPLQGSEGNTDSNILKLLHLQQVDFLEILPWLSRKTNRYTSHDIQNERLQLMALHILRQVSISIHASQYYSIMADKCANIGNKDQLTICLW